MPQRVASIIRSLTQVEDEIFGSGSSPNRSWIHCLSISPVCGLVTVYAPLALHFFAYARSENLMLDSFGVETTIIRIRPLSLALLKTAKLRASHLPAPPPLAEKDSSRLFRHAQPQHLRCSSSMVVSSWIISLRRRRKPTVRAIYPDQPDPVYRKRPRRRAKL